MDLAAEAAVAAVVAEWETQAAEDLAAEAAEVAEAAVEEAAEAAEAADALRDAHMTSDERQSSLLALHYANEFYNTPGYTDSLLEAIVAGAGWELMRRRRSRQRPNGLRLFLRSFSERLVSMFIVRKIGLRSKVRLPE